MQPNTCQRKLEVVPYCATWPEKFNTEAALIVETFKPDFQSLIIDVHHIGSTSVPGLHAKPTIDIILAVESLDELAIQSDRLASLCYHPKGANGIADRLFFIKYQHNNKDHACHLHVFEKGSQHIIRHIAVRDFLRTHPAKAKAYGQLKLKTAKKADQNTSLYQSLKHEFVKNLELESLKWFHMRKT